MFRYFLDINPNCIFYIIGTHYCCSWIPGTIYEMNLFLEYRYFINLRNFFTGILTAPENQATSWAINNGKIDYKFNSTVEKTSTGNPSIQLLVYKADDVKGNATISFLNNQIKKHNVTIDKNLSAYKLFELDHNNYNIEVNNKTILSDMKLTVGGVYTIVAYVSSTEATGKIITITQPNSVHVLWLLPQIIIITMAEVMFNITGLEFAYSQAPKTMKSLLQACWLLTVAFGHLFVVFIEKAHIFERRVSQTF